MRIVPATPADHAAILRVWEASVRVTHRFLAEDDIAFYKSLLAREALAAVDLYCVKDGQGRVLGFLGCAGSRIEMLFLEPDQRERGLGKQLVRHALERLGARAVDVNEQNPAAIGFYTHMGFHVVGRSPRDGSGRPFPLLHMELRPPV